MANRHIVVMGASAGGVEALSTVAAGLPADLPAAIFVVLHHPPTTPSILPRVLSRAGPLPAKQPEDGEEIRNGLIYVAAPDHHLLVHKAHIQLSRAAAENKHRPALDPLFRTAAASYGRHVIGVVLTGALDDGTEGLIAVKHAGGVAVVQNPEEALFSGMPGSAVANVDVDHCVSLTQLPGLLDRLVRERVTEEGQPPMSRDERLEEAIDETGAWRVKHGDQPEAPSVYTCPECRGILWEMREGQLLHFRCRVGHAYSVESLASAQSNSLEAALWTALRALEEKESLARRLEQRATQRGQAAVALRFANQAGDAARRANTVRAALYTDVEQEAGTAAAQP